MTLPRLARPGPTCRTDDHAYGLPTMIWWAIIFLAVFLIGVTKSGFGSGAGLMIVPMTALAMGRIPGLGTDAALALLLPLLVCGDLLAIWQYRRACDWHIVRRLLPGTLVGVLLGTFLLQWFLKQSRPVAEALVNIEIGAESVFLVCLHWYRLWRSKGQLPVFRPSLLRSSAVGAFAGVSSTLAHAAGPIIALHLLPMRLERSVFVGTCALYFFILNSVKLPGYWQAGLFQQMSPAFSLQLLPLVLLGAAAGFTFNRRMNDRIFSTTVYWITFLLGWYILGKGIWNLTMSA